MQQHKSIHKFKAVCHLLWRKKKKFKVKPPSTVAREFGLFCGTSAELRGLGIVMIFSKGQLMYYLRPVFAPW